MALLSGYSYRKRITIAGSSGAGTGYQVLLKIGESAGSSGADFHLEGHAANFPNDIRFTASDGITKYNYWIEKIEGVAPNRIAYVWIKVDESLDSDVNLYVYYGNPVAVSTSNGDATFEFFDDFEGPSVDTNKWDVQPGNGTIEITTIDEVSALHIGNYANYHSYIQAKNGINPTGKVAVMRTRIGNYSGEAYGMGHAWKDVFDTSTYSLLRHRTTQSGGSGGLAPYDQCVERFVNNNRETRTDPYRTTINPLPADVWSIWTLRIDSSSSAYAKSVIESTGTVINEDILSWTTPLPSTTYYAVGKYFANSNYTTAGSWGNHYVDYVYIRKYADPEPAFSFAGSEETQTIGVSFGIGSAVYTNSSKLLKSSFLNDVNVEISKQVSIVSGLQNALQYLIGNAVELQQQSTYNISTLTNISAVVNKLSEILISLQMLMQKRGLMEIGVLKKNIKDISSFVEILSDVLISHSTPLIIELKKEFSNAFGILSKTASIQSKESTVAVETCKDILTNISSALEITKSLKNKLSEASEILKQISEKVSAKVNIESIIEKDLNSLIEIIESASELIQILRTVGEKITIFRTTIDILRHTDN